MENLLFDSVEQKQRQLIFIVDIICLVSTNNSTSNNIAERDTICTAENNVTKATISH